MNMIRILAIALLTSLVTLQSSIQIAEVSKGKSRFAAHERCNCSTLLDETIAKIETNYIAYHIEIKGKRDAEFKSLVEEFKRNASQTSLEKCIPLLQRFLRFFRDGHLFIGQSPKLTAGQLEELGMKTERVQKSEAEIRSYFIQNLVRLDPIEGFWYSSDGTRFAIFRDKKPGRRDFVSVMLSDDVKYWQKGQVKAEFAKLPDGSYDVIYYNENHYPLHIDYYERSKAGGARIRRSMLLSMAPVTWGKEFPTTENPFDKIDASNPRLPVLQVIDSANVLISIPSHEPYVATVLSGLVEKNKTAIENTENLIIDLRGNHGGSSWVTNVLMPYIEAEEKRLRKYWIGDEQYVLSSERNLKYFKGVESQGWLPKNLIKRLEANPGKMLSLADPETRDIESDSPKVKELSKPRNVAILIDDAIISAGEAFIIRASRNMKVTLFGQPTAGVIDYQTTNIIGYNNCPELGAYIGYPIFAASNRLPIGGVNRSGIEPDVPISTNEKNPVQYIINYYRARNR